jgi:hypothetical protein
MFGRAGKRHPEILTALDRCFTISQGNYPIRNDLFRGLACICTIGLLNENGQKAELDTTAIKKLQNAGIIKIMQEINKEITSGTDGGRSQARGILNVANHLRHHENKLYLPERTGWAGESN